MHKKHTMASGLLRSAALVAVGAIAGIGMAVPAGAVASGITSPSVILYSDDFPIQQVTVGYTTTTNATALRIGVGGWITSASTCAVGSASRAVTVTGGSAVLSSAVTTGTSVSCTLGVAPTVAGDTTVTVEEFDAVGPAVTTTRPITAQAVAAAFDATDVDTVAGGWAAGLALAPGDELTYAVDVIADANAEDTTIVATSPGTTVTCGSSSGTTLDVSCTVTRPLTESDLLAGVAPMSVEVRQSGGATFARFARDVPVSAERRIELSMSAQPTSAAVGATVRITLEAVNRGSVTLSDVTFGGFAAGETLDCVGSTGLVPAGTFTCAFDHVVMLDEVDDPIVPTVRATSFGPDSDESNDDTVSATDVDATAATVLAAIDPGVTVTRIAQPDPIAVPVTGSALVRASIDLASAGSLSHPELVIATASGITLVGCDTSVCRVPLAATLPATDFDFSASSSSVNAGLDASMPVRLVADGGIDLPVTTLRVQTFGIAATLAGSATPVDTGVSASVTWDATVIVQPGVGGELTVAVTPAGSTLSSCHRSTTSLTPVAGAGTFSLGTQPPASTIVCTVISPIVGDAANNGRVGASVTASLQAAGATATAMASAERPGARLSVTPGAPPVVPTHGYSLDGSTERPNQFTQTFLVQLRGDTSVDPLVLPSGVSCDGVALPHPDGDVSSLTCSVTHTVTAAELAIGEAAVLLHVTGSGFDGALELVGDGSVIVPVPRESVSVTVSEISAPPPGTTYTAGDNLRLLVSVHNDGGLPLTGLEIDVIPTSSTSLVRAAAIACPPPASLAPGTGYECLVEQQVTPYDLASGQLGFVVTVRTSQGATSTTQQRITIGNRTLTLPETGTDIVALLALATLATAAGMVLLGTSKARCSRTLIVAETCR
jgi:hypothetical protein